MQSDPPKWFSKDAS